MYFTREDIRNIQHQLAKYGIKDSEFRPAKTPLDNNDIITLVQEGHNVKIRIADFLQQLHLLSQDDFINVTDQFDEVEITLLDAIRIIPEQSRRPGIVITFENAQNEWEIWQYCSSTVLQWNNVHYWEDIKTPVRTSVVADEDDLTMIERKDTNVIRFKDRAYDPENFSGRGLKYIRNSVQDLKDTVTGIFSKVNLLNQSALSKENTIYVIKNDFDLWGQTIYIPANCSLFFDGGSFKNGILECKNTHLLAPYGDPFSKVTIKGVLITQDGTEYNKQSGSYDERPTNPKVGTMYFDTEARKPIYYAGEDTWVDANGTTIQ